MNSTSPSPPPPPPPVDAGYHAGDRLDAYSLAPVGVLLGIASITTGLRLYWRVRPICRLGADDFTLVFALVLTIIWYAVDAAMYHHGRGLQGFIPEPWTMGPLVVADGVLWVWAMNVIRISIALMLLRLKDSRPWKATLWTVAAVQLLMLIVGTTMHLVMCRPLSARWAPTAASECIPPPKFIVYGYVYSAFTIASDLILSLLPVTFILHLLRPLHEKILIGCLMGAGLASTGVAIARLFLIMGHLNLGKPGPRMNMVQDMLWGFELTLGIFAASVPTLKAPVHRQLIKWGFLTPESACDTPPESFLGNRIHEGSLFTRQMRKWETTAGTENVKRPYMYTAPDEEMGDHGGDRKCQDAVYVHCA